MGPSRHDHRPLRVLVLHNTDYRKQPDAPDYASRADVENAAGGIAQALASRGHFSTVRGVDAEDLGDLLRSIDGPGSDRPDVVFNLVESLSGDSRNEGVVPSLLDLAGVAYTGSRPFALGLALRKDRVKELLRARGVPTPEGVTMHTGSDEEYAQALALADRVGWPLIVKPTREDASVGIHSSSVVRDRAGLVRATERVLDELRQPALVERFVDGRELYVSLLGNAPPAAFPFHEIDFSTLPADLPRIVSYAGKWDTASTEYVGTQPTRCLLDEETRARCERVAREAFRALELTDYGRVDVRLATDGTPYVIDVNPNCDLSDGAGFSRAASFGGCDYATLIERVCQVALERSTHEHRPRLRTLFGHGAGLLVDASGAGAEGHPAAVAAAAAGGRSAGARGADRAGRAVHGGRGEGGPRADRRSAR